jgi:hypothetical protein
MRDGGKDREERERRERERNRVLNIILLPDFTYVLGLLGTIFPKYLSSF